MPNSLGKPRTAQEIGGSGHLLFHDAVVLLLLGGSIVTLPWELAAQEVHEDVSEGLQVVTACLLNTKMGVDRGVTCGTRQILVLPVRNVEMGLWVTVLLGETKVDDVDLIATLSNTHEEIVGFDVTMNEVAGVDVFDARDLRTGSDES